MNDLKFVMFKFNFSLYFLILLFVFSFKELESENLGDLTKQKPIDKLVLLKGKNGENHFFSPNVIKFKTGKLYKLQIKNVSNSKHYFSSIKFSNSIFTRKVQILKNNEKIAEIKGDVSEIEVFPNNVVEWWFVPIKTGIFKDLSCSVMDKISKKKHKEMGMVGTIIIQ